MMLPRTEFLAIAWLVLLIGMAGADEVSEYDRFRLWSDCRPMDLVVEELGEEAAAFGLTRELIADAVGDRLASVELVDQTFDWPVPYLYLQVNVVDDAFSISIQFLKPVLDYASSLTFLTTTWDGQSAGLHGNNAEFVVANVMRHVELFLADFLRVNEPACTT